MAARFLAGFDLATAAQLDTDEEIGQDKTMSQKQRDKQLRREARRQKANRPGLSRAEQQAAFEERCAKRKAREAEVKVLAEAERTKQRLARDAREQALADAVASATLPTEGGTLRLVGLHDTHRYYYPPIVRINNRDFIVAEVKHEAGNTWLTLKPKPEPKPGLNPTIKHTTNAHRGMSMGLAMLTALSALRPEKGS